MTKVWMYFVVLFSPVPIFAHSHSLYFQLPFSNQDAVQIKKSYSTSIFNNSHLYDIYTKIPQPPSIKNINRRYQNLVKELAYVQIFAAGTIGVIATLPENFSMWSKEDKRLVNIQTLLKKHAKHISQGPVWDHDAWAINYIGHPLAGSYFYIWGKQNRLDWKESMVFTTLMSTLLWEYGWEAFAETPSIQDLIVTPILGSLLGEGTSYLYNRIQENNGKIYNTKWLGDLGRGILNPISEMNRYLNSVFNIAHIEISIDYSYVQNKENYQLRNINNNMKIIQSYFKLNFSLKY